MIRIGCTDDGYPKDKSQTTEAEPASVSDLKRARTKVPRESHKGSHFSDMSEKLNGFLKRYATTKECKDWTAEELQQFQALMMMTRAPEVDGIYRTTNDRRMLRGDEDAHGERWERLTQLASKLGGKHQKMHRDGHCHEAVMWFVHHISEPMRLKLAAMIAVPLLPFHQHDCEAGEPLCEEYLKQVSCQDCHQQSTHPSDLVV
jgi:hypothetical protein